MAYTKDEFRKKVSYLLENSVGFPTWSFVYKESSLQGKDITLIWSDRVSVPRGDNLDFISFAVGHYGEGKWFVASDYWSVRVTFYENLDEVWENLEENVIKEIMRSGTYIIETPARIHEFEDISKILYSSCSSFRNTSAIHKRHYEVKKDHLEYFLWHKIGELEIKIEQVTLLQTKLTKLYEDLSGVVPGGSEFEAAQNCFQQKAFLHV